MSDNANQPAPRPNTENSGNGGHYEQGGNRGNRSGGHYNNRKRRPSQQIGGGQEPANQPRTQGNPGAAQKREANPQASSGQQGQPSAKQPNGNRPPRQDPYHDRRGGGRRERPYPNQGGGQPQPNALPVPAQNVRNAERADQNPAVKQDRVQEQASAPKKVNPNPPQRNDRPERSERPREARNWGRNIRTEETYEDIKKDNERIEKEIWLEIAGIHTYKLD